MGAALAVLAIAAALLAGGCGESDEDRVEQVVKDYARASMDGDVDKACALTTAEMFAESGGTCQDFVRLNSRPDVRELGMRQATGDYSVEVDGDRATAKGHNLGTFELRKVSGDWKLTAVRG